MTFLYVCRAPCRKIGAAYSLSAQIGLSSDARIKGCGCDVPLGTPPYSWPLAMWGHGVRTPYPNSAADVSWAPSGVPSHSKPTVSLLPTLRPTHWAWCSLKLTAAESLAKLALRRTDWRWGWMQCESCKCLDVSRSGEGRNGCVSGQPPRSEENAGLRIEGTPHSLRSQYLVSRIM